MTVQVLGNGIAHDLSWGGVVVDVQVADDGVIKRLDGGDIVVDFQVGADSVASTDAQGIRPDRDGGCVVVERQIALDARAAHFVPSAGGVKVVNLQVPINNRGRTDRDSAAASDFDIAVHRNIAKSQLAAYHFQVSSDATTDKRAVRASDEQIADEGTSEVATTGTV